MSKQDTSQIDERSLLILKNLVERYINEGQPVGSTTLAKESTLMLSPASIRHIMADLETQGYLVSPHTSSGRMPTSKGYRLFVDNFITVQSPAQQQLDVLRSQLDAENDSSILVEKASSLLSGITQLAGLVTLPKYEKLILQHIEFLSLSAQRILVVLVVNETQVQNRVFHTDKKYTRSELEQAGNYLTERYVGKELCQVREQLLHDMQSDRDDLDEMMQTIMDMANQVQNGEDSLDYVLAGEINLLDSAQESGVEKLRSLFDAFEQKRDVLHLLDQSLNSTGVQLFIGEESGYEVFDRYSVVTSSYSVEDKVVGVLGVIGPTRMSYNKVVSAVDITAKLLSQALSEI